MTNAPTVKGEKELFYCKGSGANGVGEYPTEGFVVRKRSKGRIENVAPIQGTSDVQSREALDEIKRQSVTPADWVLLYFQ